MSRRAPAAVAVLHDTFIGEGELVFRTCEPWLTGKRRCNNNYAASMNAAPLVRKLCTRWLRISPRRKVIERRNGETPAKVCVVRSFFCDHDRYSTFVSVQRYNDLPLIYNIAELLRVTV